jgi:hypothetical protein
VLEDLVGFVPVSDQNTKYHEIIKTTSCRYFERVEFVAVCFECRLGT